MQLVVPRTDVDRGLVLALRRAGGRETPRGVNDGKRPTLNSAGIVDGDQVQRCAGIDGSLIVAQGSPAPCPVGCVDGVQVVVIRADVDGGLVVAQRRAGVHGALGFTFPAQGPVGTVDGVDISSLDTSVTSLSASVTTNQTTGSTNATNIATNATDIGIVSTTLASLPAATNYGPSITANSTNITNNAVNIASVSGTAATNTADILTVSGTVGAVNTQALLKS